VDNGLIADKWIVVTSTTFSRNEYLRERLLEKFPLAAFNLKGERLRGQRLREFLGNAEGAIVGMELIDEELLKSCPRLRIVSKYGVGMENLNQSACQKYGVTIGWTGGVNRLSVAEITLGLMLGLCRNLHHSSALLKSGRWIPNGGWQLSGKTVGIVGVGHIGKEVVRLLEPFGCRILVNDIVDQNGYYAAHTLTEVSFEEIFRASDIVTIHTPLTAATRHLVNWRTLSLMKPTSFLINTSRGSVVDQAALKEALKAGVIAGAALDVYEEEPPSDEEFLQLPNLICTPHIGGSALESIRAMGLSAIRHLENFYGLNGERS
jgi:D-3-phosphoglycerate dehydrogenase